MKLRWLAIGILACFNIWIVALRGVPAIYKDALSAIRGAPPRNSDFYGPWYGSRELLLHHRNPYGNQVTKEIREVQGEAYVGNPDWDRFVYPVYTAFLILPTLWMPFSAARLTFFFVDLLAIILSVKLWSQFVGMNLRKPEWIILTVLVLLSPPSVYGLLQQQVTVLIAGVIAAGAALVRSERFVLAGCFLALALAKPQMVALLLPWLLLWAVGEWKTRAGLVIGLAATMAVLLMASELVLPGWLWDWRRSLLAYTTYGGGSIANLLVGPRLGFWLSCVLLSWMVITLRKVQHESHQSANFAIAFSLILIVELIVTPTLLLGYNHLLLLPAVLLLLKNAKAKLLALRPPSLC